MSNVLGTDNTAKNKRGPHLYAETGNEVICGVMAEGGEPCKEVLFRVRELGRLGKLCLQRIVREGLVEKVTLEQKSD